MLREGRIFLRVSYFLRDQARKVPGRIWHKELKMWSFPPTSKDSLYESLPDHTAEVETDLKLWENDNGPMPGHGLANERVSLNHPAFEFNLDDELSNIKIPKDLDLSVDLGNGERGQPYPHQLKMVKCGLKWKKFAIFCEMGTGKTKAIIDIIKCYRHVGLPMRVLVVCPKSVLKSWKDDLDKNAVPSYTIVNGSKSQRLKLLSDALLKEKIAIINYDALIYTGAHKCWSMFNMVVLDESVYIKGHDAKRTKFCLKYFQEATFKYIMSGIPITQSATDIYCQFKFMSEEFLGHPTFYGFRNTYLVMGGYGGYKVVGYKNLALLKAKIANHSIQLKKEDCLNLPEKVFHSRVLEMPTEIAKQYKSMKRDMVVELEGEKDLTASIILVKLLRLQQIAAGNFIKPEHNAKLKELNDILDEVLPFERSVIIFARFRDSISTIEGLLQKKKINYSLLHGGIKDEDRDSAITDFQERRTNVFIIQQQAGGLGITVHAADTAIYYENLFSLEKRKQSEDRIHRIGQTATCNYIDLIYRGSIDEDVLEAIQKKQKVSSYLVESFLEGNYGLKKRIRA